MLLLTSIVGLVEAKITPLGNDTYYIPSENIYEIQSMKLERDFYKKVAEQQKNYKVGLGYGTAKGLYAEVAYEF